MRQLLNHKSALDRRRFGGQPMSDRVSLGFPASSTLANGHVQFIVDDGNAIRKEVAGHRNDIYAWPGAGFQVIVSIRRLYIESVSYNNCDAGNYI